MVPNHVDLDLNFLYQFIINANHAKNNDCWESTMSMMVLIKMMKMIMKLD